MRQHKSGALLIVFAFIFTLLGLTQSLSLDISTMTPHIHSLSLIAGLCLLITVIYSCFVAIQFKHVLVIQLFTFVSAFFVLKAAYQVTDNTIMLWFNVIALVLLANLSLKYLVEQQQQTIPQLLIATLFGFWCLYAWQFIVTVLQVPQVLLPTPTAILQALTGSGAMLWADFVQTVIKSVVIGYLLGNGLGILSAILIERSSFLQRGFLPLANLTSTIPLVGVAPIAVMWFGFDWPSKAAVIVLVTYFPALVSTLAGLQSTNKLEQELMYSYAASYWLTLKMLRLPAAMPFIFNALKVNSALALITAIVAEYFGSPTVGLGFRISVEAARMHMPVVWSAIVVASISGSVIYALLVYLERRVTFWHPAIRKA
ncbi:ABC transporter permease [Celerinatantimonas sp. YJH-8]|uniref:ABC transporter permease n=1 Tax=Celerinatantimonas sp. YJH-8 TaxID=3228714 RepID=UPI0038C60577